MKRIYLGIFAVVLTVLCVVLTIDRVRLNLALNEHGTKIKVKSDEIRKLQAESTEKIAEKQQEIDCLNARFQFITEVRTPVLDPKALNGNANDKAKPEAETGKKDANPVPELLPVFAQFSDDPEVRRYAEKVCRDADEPSPEKIKNAFIRWMAERKVFPPQKLYIDTASGRVIDRDAAVLETACRTLGMKAATEIRWNMTDIARSCRTVISSEDPAVPQASVEYGNGNFQASASCQNAPVTTLLDFPAVVLPERGERPLLLEMHEVPVGGLYVYKLSVVRAHASHDQYWLLEFRLPEAPQSPDGKKTDASAEPYSLKAFSLLPGQPIVAATLGNRLVFRVPFCKSRSGETIAWKSELIVFGDSVFFPQSVTIRPYGGAPVLFPEK